MAATASNTRPSAGTRPASSGEQADHQPDRGRGRDLARAAAEEPCGRRRGDREAEVVSQAG